MNKATITLIDDGTDEVNIKLVFGDEGDGSGANDDSAAHRMACEMLMVLRMKHADEEQ